MTDAAQACRTICIVTKIRTPLLPLQRRTRWVRYIESIDRPPATAHTGVNESLIHTRDRTLEGSDRPVDTIGLRLWSGANSGIAGIADGRGVVTQAFNIAVKLWRDECPQFATCDDRSVTGGAIAIDRAKHAIVTTVEHHHLRRGFRAVVNCHGA
ncbi:hypothetical protein D3C85_1489600 [compost metagenome]